MEDLDQLREMIKHASDVVLDLAQIKVRILAISGKQELSQLNISYNNVPLESEQSKATNINMPNANISAININQLPTTVNSTETKVPKLNLSKMKSLQETYSQVPIESETKNPPANSPEGLLHYVISKRKVRLSEASKSLNVPKDVVEKWATVLSEEGLIKISYPFFGEPTLSV